jgi:hypothetical protein
MLYLIYQLTEDPTYNGLLDNILLEVIPIVNVDGHSDETRATNNVTDLNRDLAALTTPESKNLKTEINRFNPHMVVDFHEYSPRRKDFLELNDCLTPAYDALFLYTGNLNVNPDIRNMISADIVAPAKIFLEQNQRRVNDYCTTLRNGKEVILNMGGTASRSSATNYALQNRISLLTEIRGGSEKEKATKRRIETSFLAAVSYLTTAHNNAERIIKVVDEANHETFNSTRLMVVTSTPEMKIIPYTFIDVCNLEYKVIDFNTRNGLVQTPQITRSRPAAYIISPCTEKIKTVLTVSGVNFSEIKDSKQLSDVEAYQRQSNGKLELKNLNIEWGAGGILIDMHQAMGNVIADLIEPEGNNSMYSNEIFKKLLHEDILPVYRLSKEQLLQINN